MTGSVDGSRLRARERFLGGDGVDTSVRPEISASWRRSQLNGVAPDRLPQFHVTDFDADCRLMRAAAPVLDRMATDIEDIAASLLLTDPGARILDRRFGERELRARLDDINAVPGAGYGEDAVGTNGVGTCIETRRPFIVAGGEHFAEPLCRLTCAAAPIVHPATGRLEGVLDVTCSAEDGSGLMLAFVREAAAEIARRLEELASATERALFDSFVHAARRSSRPLLSVNGEMVIANAAAAELLERADHRVVWDQVGGAVGRRAADEIALTNGATYPADVVPIAVGDRAVGALVRFHRRAAGRRPPTTRAAGLPGLVGTSPAWRGLCRDATDIASSALDVLIEGEPGVGKRATAMAIHVLGGAPTPCRVLDASTAAVDPIGWLDELSRAATTAGTVVIHHVDHVPASDVAATAGVIETAVARIVVTAEAGWAQDAPRRLLDLLPTRLVVPSLGERIDDLPVLAEDLIRRHAVDHRRVRVPREVLSRLASHPWPGNVRELDGVLRHALAHRSRGDVALDDLPVEYRMPTRLARLPPIQRLEREAILRVLDAEHGNKVAAAERLGISRSTLYRRLEAYGITPYRDRPRAVAD